MKEPRHIQFDVTYSQVIGTVKLGEGEHTPTETAMMLIAQNGDEGTYSFPLATGVTRVVTITDKKDD